MAKLKAKPQLVTRRSFPNPLASDSEKMSIKYGLEIKKAIESEWFLKNGSNCSYYDKWTRYQLLRDYARGEQPVTKFKKLIAHNGDSSFLNLDWSPLPIGEKFTDVIVNGMNERLMSVKAVSQDVTSSRLRDEYQAIIEKDMIAKNFLQTTKELFGVDVFNIENPDDLPVNTEELQLHMQLKYKPAIEIAEEQAVTTVFDMNEYHNIKYRNAHDLVALGEAWQKHQYTQGEGIVIDYVDPQNHGNSFTTDPNFKDVFYHYEIKLIPLTEIRKIKPNITEDELEEIKNTTTTWNTEYAGGYMPYQNILFRDNVAAVMYFSYKTTRNIVHKISPTKSGAKRAILRDENFNPTEEMLSELGIEKIQDTIDVWYDGAAVLGSEIMLKWEVEECMIRPESNFKRVISRYVGAAPKMHGSLTGEPKSIVSRMIPTIDQLQILHLKIQQISKRMVPDGVFIDLDAFVDVDLGNGTKKDVVQEVLSLYYSTGSAAGRTYTEDGDYNNAKYPITELTSSGSVQKLTALMNQYIAQMDILRDLTGINQARDATSPDPRALVGVQKLAALNSNTATRHILDGLVYMTRKCAEGISLRLSDILKNPFTKEEFASQIGMYNVAVLERIMDLPLHSFGIFIEVSPDIEEQEKLKNYIAIALKEQTIELEDAIEIESIKNIKLALEMLKLKKRKKQERDDLREQKKIEMQTASNIQSTREASKATIEKIKAETQSKTELEQAKSKEAIIILEKEAELKLMLMREEADLKISVDGEINKNISERDSIKEDRKDQRIDMQSTNESRLIDQKDKGYHPTNFESKEDSLDGLELSNL